MYSNWIAEKHRKMPNLFYADRKKFVSDWDGEHFEQCWIITEKKTNLKMSQGRSESAEGNARSRFVGAGVDIWPSA